MSVIFLFIDTHNHSQIQYKSVISRVIALWRHYTIENVTLLLYVLLQSNYLKLFDPLELPVWDVTALRTSRNFLFTPSFRILSWLALAIRSVKIQINWLRPLQSTGCKDSDIDYMQWTVVTGTYLANF